MVGLRSKAQSRRRTASANSVVESVPPRSAVRSPSVSVRMMALRIVPASSISPMCSRSMAPESISAVGLAIPFPAFSGHEPCTASATKISSPMFAPGATPRPPMMAARWSARMSPNMFSVTIRPQDSGLSARNILAASTSRWL